MQWKEGAEYVRLSHIICRPNRNRYSIQRFILSSYNENVKESSISVISMQYPDSELEMNIKRFKENGLSIFYCRALGLGKDPIKGINGRFVTEQRIVHDSARARIRSMPQESSVVAATSDSGTVLVYDLRQHEKSPSDHVPHPQHKCSSHSVPISSISWSPSDKGHLASCADGHVCLWEIGAGCSHSPEHDFTEQKGNIRDVKWHPFDSNEIAACGENSFVYFYDRRKAGSTSQLQAHKQAVNCIAFNPIERFLFATASSDTTVALWDSRNTTRPLHTLIGHSAPVTCLEWSPFNAGVVATGGEDERVFLWDLNRVGSDPSELWFIHGGHTAPVLEIAWNPNVPMFGMAVA